MGPRRAVVHNPIMGRAPCRERGRDAIDIWSSGTAYSLDWSRLAAAEAMSKSDRVPGLWGRHSECESLQQLVTSVRAGRSRVLVLRGEAGMGKTALLEYLASCASECRIARATGVESEMELAFAGLHQLCAPFLDRLDRLPTPQRDALGTAFGLRDGNGNAPDRFLIGLAAEPAVRRRRAPTPGLPRRRRPVARPGLGAHPRIRRPPSARGVGRTGLRDTDDR